MKKYLLTRLAMLLPLILLVSVFSFSLVFLAPGDPAAQYRTLDMSDEEVRQMMDSLFAESNQKSALEVRKARLDAANARMLTIDKIVTKLYTDNAEGKLDDERLNRMVAELEKESVALKTTIAELSQENPASKQQKNYEKFFNLARQYSHIETLDRETLLTFVERIEVGPKELMPGFEKVTHRNIPYRQSIRIFYRFIGELSEEPVRDLPKAVNT